MQIQTAVHSQKPINKEVKEDDDFLQIINQVRKPEGKDKAILNMSVNGQMIDMEIDMEAAVTVIPEGHICGELQLTTKKLRSATGQLIVETGRRSHSGSSSGSNRENPETLCDQRNMPCIVRTKLDTSVFWKRLAQEANDQLDECNPRTKPRIARDFK